MAWLQHRWEEVTGGAEWTAASPHNAWMRQRQMAKGTCLGLDFTFTLTPSPGTSGRFSLFSPHTDMVKLKVS